VLKEAQVPKVESWVYKAPAKKSCLDPGKKEYTVKELEDERDCQAEYAKKLEYRHQTLSKVLQELEGK
jgi:hypothetical protein